MRPAATGRAHGEEYQPPADWLQAASAWSRAEPSGTISVTIFVQTSLVAAWTSLTLPLPALSQIDFRSVLRPSDSVGCASMVVLQLSTACLICASTCALPVLVGVDCASVPESSVVVVPDEPLLESSSSPQPAKPTT